MYIHVRRYRIAIVCAVIFLGAGHNLVAQEILTAPRFFEQVAANYAGIVDYIANIRVSTEAETMEGELFYRAPNLIRINFTRPTDQVLVSNGEVFMLHVPRYNVTLQQELRARGTETLANLASAQGLGLLRRNYSIAYLDSPAPQPLSEESELMVTKLRLNWRTTSEGFRQLILSIDEDMVIRRIEGVTVNYDRIAFHFDNVRLNQNIPVTRFDYDPPSGANRFHNFLFEGDS
ncbi:MAG: outer membrane lipoprotein carrier protein LolA [Spirochaetaceae bacterium]|nr:MAG: outer membrane lipoprotein carrier protein LolA [Spirochaetaceae bacterium]